MTLLNKTLPEDRRGRLKEMLRQGHLVRAIEAHNGLSGIIADNARIEGQDGDDKVIREFDAIWESSLTDSASKGHPDIEVISFDSRLHTINEILAVTHKPMIVDGDTGGDPNMFEYTVSKLERAGVSAIIIEDKVFPKRNSLETGTTQTLQEPDAFAYKIKRGKAIQMTDDFMIIARLESLIAGLGLDDALKRARTYLEAGADGIMIHSKSKDPAEILEFSRRYRSLLAELEMDNKPLVCVPTTYNHIVEDELKEQGFQVVIYANHLLRSAYKSMLETARTILLNQRSFEADPLCAPLRDIFDTVGFLDVKEKDRLDETSKNTPVIIPAAGRAPDLEPVIGNKPKAMVEVAGKTLLSRQVKALNINRLTDITVVTGYGREQMQAEGVSFIEAPDYEKNTELDSILAAQDKMSNGFLMLYSDILVEYSVFAKLLACREDIVFVVDNSIQYLEPPEGKATDYVISRNKRNRRRRSISFDYQNTIAKIGKKLDPKLATHEFIGLAKFTKTGAEQFLQTYHDVAQNLEGKIQEAEDISKFRLTDLVQEMIDRGFNVHYLEIHKGWLEIHFPQDIELANELFVTRPQDSPQIPTP